VRCTRSFVTSDATRVELHNDLPKNNTSGRSDPCQARTCFELHMQVAVSHRRQRAPDCPRHTPLGGGEPSPCGMWSVCHPPSALSVMVDAPAADVPISASSQCAEQRRDPDPKALVGTEAGSRTRDRAHPHLGGNTNREMDASSHVDTRPAFGMHWYAPRLDRGSACSRGPFAAIHQNIWFGCKDSACVCRALLASPAFQRTTCKGLRSMRNMFLFHMRGGAGRYGLAGRDGVDAAAGTYSRSRLALVGSPIPKTLSHGFACTCGLIYVYSAFVAVLEWK
jgi:hypothetical protein